MDGRIRGKERELYTDYYKTYRQDGYCGEEAIRRANKHFERGYAESYHKILDKEIKHGEYVSNKLIKENKIMAKWKEEWNNTSEPKPTEEEAERLFNLMVVNKGVQE